MSQVVFLKGKKTVLRPVEKSDVPNLVRWVNDPEIRRFTNGLYPMSEGDETKWVEALEKKHPDDVVLAIETPEHGPIGVMGLHRIHPVDRTATTGAIIGEKDCWGKGFGTDAKMALLDYAFHTLNLRKVRSDVIAFNTRSARYSEKCGYQEEGRLKDHIYRDGIYHDLIILAVFREVFDSLWVEYNK